MLKASAGSSQAQRPDGVVEAGSCISALLDTALPAPIQQKASAQNRSNPLMTLYFCRQAVFRQIRAAIEQ
jgi:hypothetical protein